MKTTYKESDMYKPIRNLLAQQGFIVRGEVKGCDITAIKEDVLWIVEMKLSANITLIYQAMERKTATDWVFIAIPRPKNARDKTFPKLKKLVKKLQLGLITVALDSPTKQAEIIVFPVGKDSKNNKKTNLIKKEALARTVDTTGGSQSKVNTAFRERCVRIACLLEANGASGAKELNKLGCEKDTYNILYNNVLGWFKKAGKGLFDLSPAGYEYLNENATSSLIIYYRMKAQNI